MKDSLLDVYGNRSDEMVTQLSLYDKYTKKISHTIQLYQNSGPHKEDSFYAMLIYHRDELNKAHQEYLGEIYSYFYDLDELESH